MTYATTSASLFTPSSAPRADTDGLRLPDGSHIILCSQEHGSSWAWRTRYDDERPIEALTIVLDQSAFSVKQEAIALEKLRADRDVQNILRYAGFAVDRFYLGVNDSPRAADRAARVSSLCLRLWQELAAVGDDRANLALAMLWRSYWQALVILVGEINERLATTSELERDQAMKRLSRELRNRREDAWLIGWLDRIDTEYLRALSNWRRICLQDESARFFSEWLCVWLKQSPTQWQLLREHEIQATVWDGRSLRAPGVTTYEARGELRRLIETWYQPRYDLYTATRLRWRAGRAQDENVVLLGLKCVVLGAVRLWAGATVAYIATMLQGDTWRTLVDLTIVQSGRGFVIAAGLVSLTALYLAYEVTRRSGVATIPRVGFVLLKGEIGALAIGAIVMRLLAPSVLGKEFPANGRLLAVILYAQLTLFIGVFSLLFEQKSVTGPLAERYD